VSSQNYEPKQITLSNGWRLEFGWDEVRRAAGEAEALRELLAKLEGQGACSA
jgi:nitrogen fixation protein